MAMMDVPRTDRRLVNLPDVHTFGSDVGARIGAVGDAVGRSLGGLADGLDALDRARAFKLKMAERERDEQASLMASRYRAHARNGWNGYMARDADGNETRVRGAKDKAWDEYGDGETTLGDIERIDTDFRDREDYKKMDAATRALFEEKIVPCRNEMMQHAQQKAYADSVAKGEARRAELVQDLAQQVESTFGTDDWSAYNRTSEVCAVREAVESFAFGEVANKRELDAMDNPTVEDVRFANDPTGAKAHRLQLLFEAKQSVYDKRYFDTLTAAATNGVGLGEQSPEWCVKRARDLVNQIGRTDAERSSLEAVVKGAEVKLAARAADARARAVSEERQASTRRALELWKDGEPDASSLPAFYDSEAAAAENAGDYDRALSLRQKSKRIGDALAEKARTDADEARKERRLREELALYANGNTPSEEDVKALTDRWRAEDEKEGRTADALREAKSSAGLSGDIAARDARARKLQLARNSDRLEWMLIREQSLRAKGRTAEANELRVEIGDEFAALKASADLTAADVKSFAREFAAVPDADQAAMLRRFDDTFGMALDLDGNGEVTASEMKEFGKSGGDFEPAWAKGDEFDARTRLQLRREFAEQIMALPADVDRRSAADAILRKFEARYVAKTTTDRIGYLSSLFTDLRTGLEMAREKRRNDRRAAADGQRRADEGVMATRARAEKDERDWKAAGGAGSDENIRRLSGGEGAADDKGTGVYGFGM